MNKHINFEDNIFVLDARIRMIHDTLTIEADPGLFLEKTLDDLEFISGVLDVLLANLVENVKLIERAGEFNNLSDLEWQFDQLLTRFYNGQGGISAARYPDIREKILLLKGKSAARRKTIDDSRVSGEEAEPVVSSDELSELLKGL
ncbi:MAG: hypothetical protein LBP27_04255 [Treponema sp.]|jgi:hypothetical protein|nr:hypothetical protein [Treponema sp.]